MSRIDEALRRTARTNAPEAQAADPRTQPPLAGVDVSLLEKYVDEGSEWPEERPVQQKASEPSAVSSQREAGIGFASIPPAVADRLVISPDISPTVVEQYRRLAAGLDELQAQHGLKNLMVTSAAPQEGKTLSITNLALTLSESYHQRVLLIDMDLRRPSIHAVFGIPNETGLSDVVKHGGPLPTVRITSRLSVLTAGHHLHKPLAMLTSDRLRAVIAEAGSHGDCDWVLIDTPPIGLLPDAQLIARLSEAVLFVIAAGVTPYALVQRAINELGKERLVGTLLNRVEPQMLKAHDSYAGYYGTAGERAS